MDKKWEFVEGLQCEDGNGESGLVASDDLHDQRGRYGSQSYRNEAADGEFDDDFHGKDTPAMGVFNEAEMAAVVPTR